MRLLVVIIALLSGCDFSVRKRFIEPHAMKCTKETWANGEEYLSCRSKHIICLLYANGRLFCDTQYTCKIDSRTRLRLQPRYPVELYTP